MQFNLVGKNILLVGNWGHKNMGDEFILVGNIKLLLKENKKLFIACSNKDWLIDFHKQFLEDYNFKVNNLGFLNKNGEQIITYLQELPKGFSSTLRFFKNITDLKYYLKVDSILIGGGEIFTEETPGSYWYWLASVWFLLFTKKLYLSGGIQVPKKIWNKIPFYILFFKAKKLFIRDYEFQGRPGRQKNKSIFFLDTSIFVYNNIDLENYKWLIDKNGIEEIIEKDEKGYLQTKIIEKENKKIIVINVNKRAEKFLNKIEEKIEEYYKKDYEVYFVPVCKSSKDMDIVYYHKFKERFKSMKLLDWEKFDNFIKILSKAEKVFTTRLHLFLVSFYLNCDVEPFSYQKKVDKMKEVLLKK